MGHAIGLFVCVGVRDAMPNMCISSILYFVQEAQLPQRHRMCTLFGIRDIYKVTRALSSFRRYAATKAVPWKPRNGRLSRIQTHLTSAILRPPGNISHKPYVAKN